jgi:hypothetical protein
MDTIKTVSELYAKIDSISWFLSVGIRIESQSKIRSVSSLEQAISGWKSDVFTEARCVAWEAFRREIAAHSENREQWAREFQICSDKITTSITKSEIALSLIEKCGQDLETFCQGLPFLGAVGELLAAKPEYNFNLSQLPLFFDGHWICGWDGPLFKDEFVYPQGTFLVY